MFNPPTEPISSAQSAAPDPAASRLEYENPSFRARSKRENRRAGRRANRLQERQDPLRRERSRPRSSATSPRQVRRKRNRPVRHGDRPRLRHGSVEATLHPSFGSQAGVRPGQIPLDPFAGIGVVAIVKRYVRWLGTQPIACCSGRRLMRSFGRGSRSGSERQASMPITTPWRSSAHQAARV